MKPQLSIEAFADWCEKQPADAMYNWHDDYACAGYQYAKSLGLLDAWFDRHGSTAIGNALVRISQAALGSDTFGDLAARLRTAQVQS